MKALELAVYPPVPPDPAGGKPYSRIDLCYRKADEWRKWRDREERLMRQKRLTDAELAAEMHAANSAAWRAHSTKGVALPLLEDRFETLYRFAALPHYDEPQP